MIPGPFSVPEHETFRDSVRRFMKRKSRRTTSAGRSRATSDKDVWKKAARTASSARTMPREYGGAGADKLYSVVLIEEQARANNSSLGFGLHSEIVAPYLQLRHAALKQKYLPKMAAGEMIGAIAMSEPAPAPTCRR
jgi:acyl-CoA dehydrogenase